MKTMVIDTPTVPLIKQSHISSLINITKIML